MMMRVFLLTCAFLRTFRSQSTYGSYCSAVGDNCDCTGFMSVKSDGAWSPWSPVVGTTPCQGGSPSGYCVCQEHLSGTASQSSLGASSQGVHHEASHGADFSLTTFSLTGGFRGELNPWWQVDFGRIVEVGTIRYRNRDDDGCASLLLEGWRCEWNYLPEHKVFEDRSGAMIGVSRTSCQRTSCPGSCDRITADSRFSRTSVSKYNSWFELNGCAGKWGRYAFILLPGQQRVLSVVEMQVLKNGHVEIPAGLPVNKGFASQSVPVDDDSDFVSNMADEMDNTHNWFIYAFCLFLFCCARPLYKRFCKDRVLEGDTKKPSAYQRIVDAMGLRGRTAIPIYWENSDRNLEEALDRSSPEFFDEKYPVSPEVHSSLEELMNSTSIKRADLGLTVVRAVRIEDSVMWASYQQCAAEIKENRECCEFQGEGAPITLEAISDLSNSSDFSHNLDSELCEAYLWHATSPEAAMKIAEDGFRTDLSARGRYGRGAYFAEDPGKSDSYAQPGKGLYSDTYAMLLCRCVLGEQRLTTRGSESIVPESSYDSTLAEPDDEAREFIVYRDEQVYPEYAIVYERRDPNLKDEHMYWEDENIEAIKDSLPIYWTNNSESVAKRRTAQFDEMYPAHSMKGLIQDMADKTWRNKWTRDRKGSDGQRIPMGDPNKDMPEGMRILKVLRVEDSNMWAEYMNYQDEVRIRRGEECASLDYEDVKTTGAMGHHRRRLSGDVNEVYLWHGSSPHAVISIAEDGFKVDMTKGGLFFGPGAYFAECSSKADEYSKDEEDGYYKGYYAMLLCRVTLGQVQILDEADPQAHTRVGASHDYDSTLGDREKKVGTYREFVVPTKLAVYPEYAIIYERRYNTTRVRGIQSQARPEPAPARPVYWKHCDDAEEE